MKDVVMQHCVTSINSVDIILMRIKTCTSSTPTNEKYDGNKNGFL